MNSLELLPPILASVGGLFSFMVKESPLRITDEAKRRFASAVFLVAVWVGYFITLLAGKYFFYSPFLTILPALCGLIFLTIVLYMTLHRSHKSSHTVLPFIFALFFLSIGFTNYFLPQNKIVLLFEPPEQFEKLKAYDKQESVIGDWQLKRTWLATGIILERDEFDTIEEFELFISNPKSTETLSQRDIRIEKLGNQGGLYVYRL